jgi:hypothetical protein
LIEIIDRPSPVPANWRLRDAARRLTMREWLRRLFSGQIIADVPLAVAACEDCRKTQCRDEEFAHCEYRLARQAALRACAAQEPDITPRTKADTARRPA